MSIVHHAAKLSAKLVALSDEQLFLSHPDISWHLFVANHYISVFGKDVANTLCFPSFQLPFGTICYSTC
jgi:hypothetical protein